jgi:hypothetical protein
MVRDSALHAALRRIKYILRWNKLPQKRLKLMQDKPQEGKRMVKGLSKRVIVVKNPDGEMFEEAIFILREDALARGEAPDVLAEAQRAADSYLRQCARRRFPMAEHIAPPAWLAAGAAVTGAAWLAAHLAGF